MAGTQPVRVLGIDHVNVTTPEELESEVVTWYSTVLALEQIDKPPGTRSGGSWFEVGDQELHVSVDPHNPPKTAHFAMVVDDFDAIVNRLREGGYHIEQAVAIPGRQRCFTRDPAGNRVEIVWFEESAERTEYAETSEDPGVTPLGGMVP